MFGPDLLPRSFEAALRDCESDKQAVRLSAVRDLGRHAADDRSGRALAALRETLAKDESAEVRGQAALALADAEARTATEALIRAMTDSNVYVRQMSLLALGELGGVDDLRIADAVRSALADDAPALRFQGLIASHKLGAPWADASLLAAAKDADAEVRHVALRLLEERATDVEGVARPGDATKDAARAALADAVLAVRLAAAILLARAGDRSGDAVIAETLTDARGCDAEDEQTAIVLSGELRIEAARPGLERRAFRLFLGPNRFRYEALIALARLGDARARGRIARDLTAWSRDARTLAVVAAGRAGLVEARAAIESMRGEPRRAEPDAVEDALRLLECAPSPRA